MINNMNKARDVRSPLNKTVVKVVIKKTVNKIFFLKDIFSLLNINKNNNNGYSLET